jgi:two-component system response regulator HydG
VDVTVIAATNRDLRAEVAAGGFRGDLYYRLNVVGLNLPPLRERREDIPYLTAAFLRDCAARLRKPLSGLTSSAERLLLTSPWNGNVRELKNAIERACILAEGPIISERELLPALRPEPHAPMSRGYDSGGDGPAALGELEREHIVDVLRQVQGNRMAAAKVLGISRRALYRRLERYEIGSEAPPRRAYLPRPR